MSNDKPRLVAVAGGVLLLVIIVIAVALALVLNSDEPEKYLGFLATMIVPAAVSLLALARIENAGRKVDQVTETVQNVAADVGEVKEQTNGAMHALVDRVEQLQSGDGAIHEQGQADGGAGRASGGGGR